MGPSPLTLFTDGGRDSPLSIMAFRDIRSSQLVTIPTKEEGLHSVVGLRRDDQAMLRLIGQLATPGYTAGKNRTKKECQHENKQTQVSENKMKERKHNRIFNKDGQYRKIKKAMQSVIEKGIVGNATRQKMLSAQNAPIRNLFQWLFNIF
ncbi:hypothetical protein NPIL_252961 [Nephila pilipes]|uniref:Uncharacterized protein n=1 Tax=Nephila pilipes TaxID=299642 RepID=A0A8X6UJ07_NEPPI|nr:hypothetical protein NPIL_252961 [Nephila pilipes]